MPTIEYGRPSAFGDIRAPGFPGGLQDGPDWYDDLAPTTVSAGALVTNAGNAAGSVIMELRNMDVDPDGEVLQADGPKTVNPAFPDGRPGEAHFDVSIGVATSAVKNFGVFVLDATTRPWKPLISKVFTINSYEIPRNPNLSSGTINISVT